VLISLTSRLPTILFLFFVTSITNTMSILELCYCCCLLSSKQSLTLLPPKKTLLAVWTCSIRLCLSSVILHHQSHTWQQWHLYSIDLNINNHPQQSIRLPVMKYQYCCCYDHWTFTATTVVGYHWTNTAIAVFYSVLGGLSGRCFLKTVPYFCRVG